MISPELVVWLLDDINLPCDTSSKLKPCRRILPSNNLITLHLITLQQDGSCKHDWALLDCWNVKEQIYDILYFGLSPSELPAWGKIKPFSLCLSAGPDVVSVKSQIYWSGKAGKNSYLCSHNVQTVFSSKSNVNVYLCLSTKQNKCNAHMCSLICHAADKNIFADLFCKVFAMWCMWLIFSSSASFFAWRALDQRVPSCG